MDTFGTMVSAYISTEFHHSVFGVVRTVKSNCMKCCVNIVLLPLVNLHWFVLKDVYSSNEHNQNYGMCLVMCGLKKIPDSGLKIKAIGDKKQWQAGSIYLKHHTMLVDVGTTGRLSDGFCNTLSRVVYHKRNESCSSKQTIHMGWKVL